MVSLLWPNRRKYSKDSPTVMFLRKLVYSVVIMLPAEFSGYCKMRLIVCRFCGLVRRRTRVTRFAGISSRKSTASSTKSSATSCVVSASEKACATLYCASGDKWANTSAPMSLGNMRNTRAIFSSDNVSRKFAMSTSLSSSSSARSLGKFCSSKSSVRYWIYSLSSYLRFSNS